MVQVWFVMKIFLLLFIILIVLLIFNYINKLKKQKNSKDKTIDLEKDPKTNEYKPKE